MSVYFSDTPRPHTHTHTQIKWRRAQIRYGTPPSPGTPLTPPSHTVYRWTMNIISAKNRPLFEADPVNFYANSVPAFQDRQALLSSVARCGIWQIISSEVGGKVSLHKTFWSKLIWRKVVGLTILHRSNLLAGGGDGRIRIGQKGPDLDPTSLLFRTLQNHCDKKATEPSFVSNCSSRSVYDVLQCSITMELTLVRG